MKTQKERKWMKFEGGGQGFKIKKFIIKGFESFSQENF